MANSLAQRTRVEGGALGNIIRRAARAVRRDSRRNWKWNRFHRSDRDLEEVVPIHGRVQSTTSDPIAPTAAREGAEALIRSMVSRSPRRDTAASASQVGSN